MEGVRLRTGADGRRRRFYKTVKDYYGLTNLLTHFLALFFIDGQRANSKGTGRSWCVLIFVCNEGADFCLHLTCKILLKRAKHYSEWRKHEQWLHASTIRPPTDADCVTVAVSLEKKGKYDNFLCSKVRNVPKNWILDFKNVKNRFKTVKYRNAPW